VIQEDAMKEIAPGLFVESSYAPYNLVLIKTDRGGVMVDLPPNPPHAIDWFAQARAILGEIRYVVMTDAKRERQMGTVLCEVPIIATEATLRSMMVYDEERPRRDFLEALAAQFPGAVTDQIQKTQSSSSKSTEADRAESQAPAGNRPRPRKPAVAFNESFTLHAGDRVLKFEAIEGSGEGSLWVLIEGEGILIAGDTVAGDDVPLMADTPDSKAWLNTMTALSRRQDVRVIVPGHGEARLALGDIEPQREFMRVMRRAARTLARKGHPTLSLTQTAQELGQTFYNSKGNQAVKKIKAGLENLVNEVVADERALADERARAEAQAIADNRALAEEQALADERALSDDRAAKAEGPESGIGS
jgi:glyoxylase-like metal-dependent hydrolase (beta-lactamase superfamily II)